MVFAVALKHFTNKPPLMTHRGAGTDANVFIELHGENGVIGQTRLDTAANNFERNKEDVFTVRPCRMCPTFEFS